MAILLKTDVLCFTLDNSQIKAERVGRFKSLVQNPRCQDAESNKRSRAMGDTLELFRPLCNGSDRV